MKHISSLAAVLLLGLALAARAEDPPTKDKPIVVPFEQLKSGHMAIMAKVEGKGPYKFIFDTGAPINIINNKVAKDAGLIQDKKSGFSLFGTMGDVKVKKLEVGDAVAKDVPAIIMDHPTVSAISDKLGPIEGIIGFPFFARYKMTLNYKDKTMTLVPNGFEPPDVMQAMQAALMASILGGQNDKPIILSSEAQFGLTVTKESKDEDAGVTVKAVAPNGPAAKAGIQEGDRLLTLDDRWTDSVNDTYSAAGFVKPGTTVVLKVSRKGKTMELKVTPGRGW